MTPITIVCKKCQRAVYASDVDKAGLCCYCAPPALTAPAPIVTRDR